MTLTLILSAVSIAAITVAAIYFHFVHLRRRPWWARLLWWMAVALAVGYFAHLARDGGKDYIPDDIPTMELQLLLLTAVAAPLFVVAVCGTAGHFLRRHRRRGETVGWCLAVLCALCSIYAVKIEPRQLNVRRVELAFSDLPDAFDGYRIVLFSDLHAATMAAGRQKLLAEAIDSINAQEADLVAFCGDMQNKRPEEVEPIAGLLASVKARDNVCSVLGNHDYTMYLNVPDAYTISRNNGLIRSLQEDLGWTLLDNTHVTVRRDTSRIFIAGMENDGTGRFPQLGNLNQALWGISRNDFVVLLEHDPTSWRRKILPHSHTQLTLSGHTHGGQAQMFGFSPAKFIYRELDGLYTAGERKLFVTTGIGGVIPFRLFCTPEIVVITLRKGE